MMSCHRSHAASLHGAFWFLAVLAIALAGCQPAPQIARYTVPKPESIETPAKEPRTSSGPPARPASAANPRGGDLTFDIPEGWREIPPASSFTLRALEAVKDDQRIEVTISAVGGDLTQNMNRWRTQIGLPETSADEIKSALKPREINGLAGQFIEIHQPESAPDRQSILGYVVPEGEQTWFIKLRGSTALAEQEREHLEAFAQSLKW